MSKKLAIKGHETRGKEIIELLEMTGGTNKNMLSAHIGDVLNPHVYFLEPDFSDNRIVWNYLLGLEWDGRASDMMIFTLEEFLEKYPYKVGDKVQSPSKGCIKTITGMKWNPDMETITYELDNKIYTNADILNVHNNPKHDMETKVETKREYDELRTPLDDDDKLATEVTIMGKRILPPDGYLVGKITQTDNGMLVEYVNKNPKYPTTYVECKEILGENVCYGFYMFKDLLNLFICRDAYYKIYGEEMGLGKPWEPAIQDNIWDITRSKGEIEKYSCHYGKTNFLEFPTEEMRDIFFENFKDLIEQCKELL